MGPSKAKVDMKLELLAIFIPRGALFSVIAEQSRKHPALTQDGEIEHTPNQHIENMRDGATAGFKYFDFRNASKISVTVRGRDKVQ